VEKEAVMAMAKDVPGAEVVARSKHDGVEIRVHKARDIVSDSWVFTVQVLVDEDRWIGMSWKEGTTNMRRTE
jgi:hypothetical protein